MKKFKELLSKRKEELLQTVSTIKEQARGFSPDDLPDEVDLASSESEQSLSLRLRDRERVLLKKIDKMISRIDEGTYGVCESCGEEIGIKRLEARPVTDLCIRCKEEQEKLEKSFAE